MNHATACLQAATLMKEAGPDARITVTIRGVSRAFYESVPFAVEVALPQTGQWLKELAAEGISVEVLTSEAPPAVIPFPPRKPELRIAK